MVLEQAPNLGDLAKFLSNCAIFVCKLISGENWREIHFCQRWLSAVRQFLSLSHIDDTVRGDGVEWITMATLTK